MRKILFVMFAALAFVACEKEEDGTRHRGCRAVGITLQESYKHIVDNNGDECYYPYLDVAAGDNLSFTTDCDAFIPTIMLYDKDEKQTRYQFKRIDTECDFEIGTVAKVGERSYELKIFPNAENQYKCVAFSVSPLNKEEGCQASLLLVFLDENALIE